MYGVPLCTECVYRSEGTKGGTTPVWKFWLSPAAPAAFMLNMIQTSFPLCFVMLRPGLCKPHLPLCQRLPGKLWETDWEREEEGKCAPSSPLPLGFLPACTPPAKILHGFVLFFLKQLLHPVLDFPNKHKIHFTMFLAGVPSLGLCPRCSGCQRRHQLKLLVLPPQKSAFQLGAPKLSWSLPTSSQNRTPLGSWSFEALAASGSWNLRFLQTFPR